ncbi:MAG TPA: hypothetical protein VKH19_08080 [Gemmatimonadaceae bacterium]|nr:hypothetical protein [Gemmatimonadaceae bacterium]
MFNSRMALVAAVLISACARHPDVGLPRQMGAPLGEIVFHNSSGNRIQVYLVADNAEWLLGRLEPYETARLRVPQPARAEERQMVSLVVIRGWSRALDARQRADAPRSLREVHQELVGQDWMFVNGQLAGPRVAQRP